MLTVAGAVVVSPRCAAATVPNAFRGGCLGRTRNLTVRASTRLWGAAPSPRSDGGDEADDHALRKVISRSFTATSYEETPLATKGKHLLEGLDVYSVKASDDGHPLAVYGISSQSPQQPKASSRGEREVRPILLLHGRTWSSVPVYHLHMRNAQYVNGDSDGVGGGTSDSGPVSTAVTEPLDGSQSRSLMEALLSKGLQPYCLDFRGFGGTPHDDTKCVEPNRCVEDAETVLQWIATRHGMGEGTYPALLGWSQGALVAQLAAQKPEPKLSKLVLYGSIYDPLVRYAREPLYASKQKRTRVPNSFDDAIEDFTLEGTIPPEPAKMFAQAALISDPVKAQWIHTYQFNNCDPARVHVPTLVIAGDQDPYAPLHVQQELFTSLGRGCDRTWSILSNCDHAVHLLEGRDRMINIVVSFVQNGKRTR
jgi:pimeloyl-ACP methyl ester carboxylesterase